MNKQLEKKWKKLVSNIVLLEHPNGMSTGLEKLKEFLVSKEFIAELKELLK